MTQDPPGWLLLSPAAVPDEWRARAVAMSLVPLLPAEAATVLAGGTARPQFAGEEELLRLVAAGCTRAAIARRLGVSVRTVQRRLARVQESTGVRTLPELTARLAKRGF